MYVYSVCFLNNYFYFIVCVCAMSAYVCVPHMCLVPVV